jgi:hypothetical protein
VRLAIPALCVAGRAATAGQVGAADLTTTARAATSAGAAGAVRFAIPALCAAVLAGCGTAPAATSPEPAPAAASAASAAEGEAVKTARIGEPVTLAAQGAPSLSATAVRVVDPAAPADRLLPPDGGTRFVAVQFLLTNVGRSTYHDDPGLGARLIDTHDQQYNSELAETAAGPSMTDNVRIGPGSRARGFVTFQLPLGARPSRIQFTLDSGDGPQTAEWHLG